MEGPLDDHSFDEQRFFQAVFLNDDTVGNYRSQCSTTQCNIVVRAILGQFWVS